MALDYTTWYKPGQKCPTSGIYTVKHDDDHEEHHEVTVVMGEVFPPCNHCGPHPRFQLNTAAVHVKNHKLFK